MFLPLLVLTGCGDAGDVHKVFVVNNVDGLEGLVSRYEASLVEVTNHDIKIVEVDLDDETLSSALSRADGSAPDLVVSFSTPLSLDVVEALDGTEVPQVFGMVTDPIGSGLAESLGAAGANRTGVGLFSIQQTVAIAHRATGLKTLGVLNNPGDAASAAGYRLASESAAPLGVDIVEIVVDDSSLEDMLLEGPPPSVDAILVVGSPFVSRNMRSISNSVRTWDVPVVGALSLADLTDGFLLGVAPDHDDLARQMADRSVAVLNGGAAGEISVGVSRNVKIVDMGEAERLGVDIADDVLVEFDTVVGEG